MSLLSVIIPTYNRKELLPRAVHSVLAQKGVPFELIIVDDGSSDETDNLVREKFNCCHCEQSEAISPLKTDCHVALRAPRNDTTIRYLHQDHRGPSAARNLGIRQAKGEWIAFLDSDDEWKTGKLKAQMAFFEKNPDFLICQTEEIWIRNGQRVNPMKKHQKYGGWIFEKCLPLCVISPSAVMLHRKLFDEVGPFDESLPACEDYDLWLRIASCYPVGLIEKPYVIKYGGHADQRSREFPAMDLFRIRSLSKILAANRLTSAQSDAARKTLDEKARIYIQGALKRGKTSEAKEVEAWVQQSTGNASHKPC